MSDYVQMWKDLGMDLDAARACIADHNAEYYDILPLEGQIKSRRDQYC